VNLTMGPMILEHRGPWKPPEQGRHSSDVLASPGNVWEVFIVVDDLQVHIAGHGERTPPISLLLDLLLELCIFLLELESCFLELLVSGLQLLYPQVRWGPCSPLEFVVKVIHWGSLSLMDAFDVSLRGYLP